MSLRQRALLPLLAFVIFALVSSVLAQKTTGGGSGSAPGGSTPRVPTAPPPTVQSPNLTNPTDMVLFISGRLSVDDGTQLPSNIVVNRVCNGQTRQQVHADMKGNFTFELGARFAEITTDVSVSAPGPASMESQTSNYANTSPSQMGLSRQALWSCEINAEASGYRSASVNLGSYSPGQTIDVGTIFLQRGEKTQGTTISATAYQAPKDAKKAYEKGLEAMRKGNFADAQKHFEKAVDAYPQYANAWYQLGNLLDRQNQTEPARTAYDKAIAADSRFVPPYVSMAILAARDNNWNDVLRMSQRGIDLDPMNYPVAYYFNSLANYRLKNLPAAEKGARSAEHYDQQHRFPQVHLLLASILSDNKAYAEAITEYTTFLKLAPDSKDADAVKARMANLEKLASAKAAPEKAADEEDQ